jgi:hypothetical protein
MNHIDKFNLYGYGDSPNASPLMINASTMNIAHIDR